MKILKFNESFDTTDTFKDVEPCDLIYMTREQIIELISNTFESEVIEDDPEWTIVKSKWKVLEKDNELTKLRMKDILDIEDYVYFHIYPDDYTIVRGAHIQEFLKKAQSINNSIRVDGGTEGQSLILKGKDFYEILFALSPIPKGESSVITEDDEWYSLKSLGCGGDIRLDGKKISYYSDLMVGSDFEMNYSLKNKYPGLTKNQAIQKDIEERSKPTIQPKVIKGLKDSGIFKGTPDWNEYNKFLVQFSYENMLFDICDGLKKRNIGEYYFENPKHFEKMKFNIHEYEPADVYYAIRVSEIQNTDTESESFTFQWFGKLFANEEHLQNHYKKYPHFGPGGKNHTYTASDGTQQLSYQPPMYKDVNSIFGYSGDSIGEMYYCEDRDSLFYLLEQFNDFMKDDSQSHFETDYPKYKK